MKKMAKKFVAAILGWQVRRLRVKNNFKTVGVTGSIGKTSTKFAIATVLKQQFAVQSQAGNYNDLVSAPLIFFGQDLPNIYNPLAWLKVFFSNEKIIRREYPYEIVVVEIGTDAPGQIAEFSRYLQLDIGVLTAITPEHMEFFDDLKAVAKEELAISRFTDKLLINKDLCPAELLGEIYKDTSTYGMKQPAEVRVTNIKFDGFSSSFDIEVNGQKLLHAGHEDITEPVLYSVCAAGAVANELGMHPLSIKKGIDTIKPVNGRMMTLRGVNRSTIIDDTYNASPEAMKAALDTLYRIKADQKIAILGNMNELGGYSEPEHRQIGQYCNPEELDLVITIGPDANKYLAPAAAEKGCEVKQFNNPYETGEYLKELIKPGAVILAKGSQNGVFAEETVKILLADKADSSKLVRQTPDWLRKKQKLFSQV
jgi:UDP-N-acetylmuramoyl-tripeptide--D-alanyl-D-alanine ligase